MRRPLSQRALPSLERDMLHATQEETDHVLGYMRSQAPGLQVEFAQKMYSENVLSHRHDVWDVHTSVDRWWVITNPMNLYSQEQFPNMDLAVTFHVGLCLRIPRTENQKLSDLPVEPFLECCRCLLEATDALAQAEEVADFQTIGVRCREALLAFVDVAQEAMPWTTSEVPPKKGDLKAWADHICSVSMSGAANENRRHLFRTQLEASWKFANWLTHAKNSNWYDAEAACSAAENAITLCISAIIRHVRGVPDICPACGSYRLSPERGSNSATPNIEWERPTCNKCDWVGDPAPIREVREVVEKEDSPPVEGECVIPTEPLRKLAKPRR